MSFDYEGSTIETDENGYLVSLEDWAEGVAGKLAEDEEIDMNDEHWEIINFLRDYYQEFFLDNPIGRNILRMKKILPHLLSNIFQFLHLE